jgi:outer membrane immunogenic protein
MLTTGHVAAEGLPRPPSRIMAPGTPVGPGWSGFYVGAGLGAGALSQDLSGEEETLRQVVSRIGCQQIITNQIVHRSFSDSDTGDIGAFGTVTIGYDRRLTEGWVGGVFADYDFGSGMSVDLALPGGKSSADHNYSWSVGGRLGFLITESTLLYGTGGFTQASFDTGNFGSKTFSGYFVGAGIETLLAQSWSLKLEYRYSHLGSETVVDTTSLTADLEPSMHTARLVLSYKLGQ